MVVSHDPPIYHENVFNISQIGSVVIKSIILGAGESQRHNGRDGAEIVVGDNTVDVWYLTRTTSVNCWSYPPYSKVWVSGHSCRDGAAGWRWRRWVHRGVQEHADCRVPVRERCVRAVTGEGGVRYGVDVDESGRVQMCLY